MLPVRTVAIAPSIVGLRVEVVATASSAAHVVAVELVFENVSSAPMMIPHTVRNSSASTSADPSSPRPRRAASGRHGLRTTVRSVSWSRWARSTVIVTVWNCAAPALGHAPYTAATV